MVVISHRYSKNNFGANNELSYENGCLRWDLFLRTSTHMEVLFSCLLAITLDILIIVSLLQYKQQSKSLQKDIENRSPFVTFCKMWSASSAGMSTPSAAATVNPSLTLAFYHCHILGDRPLIKYCRLSIVVTPVVSRTFLHSLLYNKCIWSKRSVLLPKDRQRLWTQESQTPHEGW